MEKAVGQLDYFTQNDWRVSVTFPINPYSSLPHMYFTDLLIPYAAHSPPSYPPSLPLSPHLSPLLLLFCPQWSHTNHDRLLSLMSEEDKQEFDFDIRTLNWDQYIHDFCMGTKQYLFKEDLTNLPVARRQIKRWPPFEQIW